MDHGCGNILKPVEECRSALNIDKKIEILYAINSIDKKIEILYAINSMLPKSQHLKIPSLITNDYVYLALSRVEEMVLVAQ